MVQGLGRERQPSHYQLESVNINSFYLCSLLSKGLLSTRGYFQNEDIVNGINKKKSQIYFENVLLSRFVII